MSISGDELATFHPPETIEAAGPSSSQRLCSSNPNLCTPTPPTSHGRHYQTFGSHPPVAKSECDGHTNPLKHHIGGIIAPPSRLFLSATDFGNESLAAEDSTGSRMTSRQKGLLVMLAFANFCSTVVFSCIAPFFPGVASKKGVSQTIIGLIFGSFELVIMLVSPILGKYMTEIGPKFMYTTGLFATAVTSILFGLLVYSPDGVTFVALCFAVRIFEAFGDAAILTASFSIVANEFPGNVASTIGYLEVFSGLGFTVGPALGGVLFEAGGYITPFLFLGILLAISWAFSIKFVPSQQSKIEAVENRSIFSLFKHPRLILGVLSAISAALSLSFMDPTLETHLDKFNLSSMVIGFVFLVTSGTYTVSTPLLGYLVDKKENIGPIVLMGGAFINVITFFLIGPSPLLSMKHTLWLDCVSLGLLGLAAGAQLIPAFQECLTVALQNGFSDTFYTYGIISGLFQSSYSLGAFIGSTVGSSLVEAIGFEWTATLIAALNIILIGLLIIERFSVHYCSKTESENQRLDQSTKP